MREREGSAKRDYNTEKQTFFLKYNIYQDVFSTHLTLVNFMKGMIGSGIVKCLFRPFICNAFSVL